MEDTVLSQGLRYNLLKETFILTHDFSRLGSWLPGPMSFTEHSGRNMRAAQLFTRYQIRRVWAGHVGTPLALSTFYSSWATRSFDGAAHSHDVSFPLSYCPTYSSFLETTPHIHPAMTFTGPGHLSIQYTDKTGGSSFIALGESPILSETV